MKRYIIALMFCSFIFSYAQTAPKALLFMRDASKADDLELMLKKEVGVIMDTLKKYGYTVVVTTLDGKDVTKGATTIKCDIKVTDAKIADYDGVILPCLGAPSYPAPPYVAPEAETLVKNAVAAGKPVAAQTGSVWTLAKAGLLKGKKFCYALQETHAYFDGATYTGTGVVRDGLIITSGICPYTSLKMNLPDGTPLFALTFVQTMKDVSTLILHPVATSLANPSGRLQFQLFTLSGKVISHERAKTKVGIMKIPAQSVTNGVYVVKMTDGKGFSQSSRRVLMR